MRGIFSCLTPALTIDGTLGKKEQKQRTMFFVIITVAFVLSLADVVLNYEALQERYVHQISYAFYIPASLYAMLTILCKRKLTTAVMVGVAYSISISLFLVDLSVRTLNYSFWPSLVLIVDFLLVMKVEPRYSFYLVCFTVLWILVIGLEQTYRFGLFDLPGLPPQDGEYGRREFYRDLTDCEAPPCKTNTLGQLATPLSVFVLDFIATRGFARDVLQEQASMERTINAVQEIATLLAGYDVEQVAGLLETHEHELPEGMTVALRRLEENLRLYKAYLPKTCLPFEEPEEQKHQRNDDHDVEAATPLSSKSSSTLITRAQPALTLSSVHATLLVTNVKRTLRILHEDSTRFAQLFTALLVKTLRTVDVRHGMVDVFIGDRIHCSFNASRRCASHATNALHTATMLLRSAGEDLASHINIGVATGHVLRGDMGCETMRRFSMVGLLLRDVMGMERAGRMLGCAALCNRICFSDGECEHHLRLIPYKVEVHESADPEIVAELLAAKVGDELPPVSGEWMYMIGGKKDWEAYNTAVRGYLRDAVSPEEVAALWAKSGGKGTPANAVPTGTHTILSLCGARGVTLRRSFDAEVDSYRSRERERE